MSSRHDDSKKEGTEHLERIFLPAQRTGGLSRTRRITKKPEESRTASAHARNVRPLPHKTRLQRGQNGMSCENHGLKVVHAIE